MIPSSSRYEPSGSDSDATSLQDLLRPVLNNLGPILFSACLGAALAVGLSYIVNPLYTASASILPPQQQSSSSSALAALNSLSALTGIGSAARTPAEQYASLMRSNAVVDRIVNQFELMKVYESEYRVDARKALNANVKINIGKKDGLMTIAVEDSSAQRAAEIANQYIEELRRITSNLAVTEAQQRRVFFESRLVETRSKLVEAQQTLQSSGFNPGALKAEPKAAAENYARLKAETSAAELRLQSMRTRMTESTPEVQQQLTLLSGLRSQLARAEQPAAVSSGADYIGAYRDFKYQEALFEVYSRQFEIARVDESREGALIQVIDAAHPPERRSSPKRLMWLFGGAASGLALWLFWLMLGTIRRLRSTQA